MPNEKAKIQRKTLRREKNLALSKDIHVYAEKERVQSKVILRKLGVGWKWRREFNKMRWNWSLS